ncbi:MAG: patatin-like phospholipase family protein [Bacteroides sp.]|nr:patatin-like phospholipase family protein [Roseburia sp.]MCM1345633.1 patatin-like phospholipase family protein [Bacteroides sp.]MCM1420937.1 patatin-like phospholipase family protein [Bacteroides sp.]
MERKVKKAGARPVIAVVLSGGGAKGAAHVGALKVIEEAGIPVDIVVGTSMGAIVGGLYSSGYTPESIDSIFRVQDWMVLLTDRKESREESFLARERQDNYIMNIPLGIKRSDSLSVSKAGIIEGVNVMKMFRKLTKVYPDSIDFDKLPIRFACVAEDIVSGDEIVFRRGDINLAMRSSMSIPGVFRPIRKDSMLLVDGGILNNYPVDIAREMGADIVIGVDLGEGMLKVDKIKSVMDIVNQISGIAGSAKYKRNKKDTDIYIKVDVTGYNAASFTKNAIDTLIARGEEAARKQFDALKSLSDDMGGNNAYMERRRTYFDILKNEVSLYSPPEYVFEPFPADAISFGANFDQEEMASLIMQGYVHVPFFNLPTQVGTTIRLGKRYKFKLNLSSMPAKGFYVGCNYEVGYNDVKFNEKGINSLSTTFSDNIISLNVAQSWRYAKVGGGVRFNNYNFKSTLVDKVNANLDFSEAMEGSRNFWDFFVNVGVNTTNRKIFATHGIKMDAEANMYRGHEVTTSKDHYLYSFHAFTTVYCPTSARFCLIPSGYIRYMNRQSNIYGIYNIVGGQWDGHYLPAQIPFYGISNIERAQRSLIVARLQGRMRLGQKHYVSAIFNVGSDSDGFHEIINENLMLGYGINYSYDSFVGPLSLTLSSSNITEKVDVFVSLGFTF